MNVQPIAVRVTRYRCPFCTHSRSSKQTSVEHIGRCWENPENRTCNTCSNYEPPGDGDQCVPGQNCNCNVYPPSCGAGIPFPADPAELPIRNCSEWRSWADEE